MTTHEIICNHIALIPNDNLRRHDWFCTIIQHLRCDRLIRLNGWSPARFFTPIALFPFHRKSGSEDEVAEELRASPGDPAADRVAAHHGARPQSFHSRGKLRVSVTHSYSIRVCKQPAYWTIAVAIVQYAGGLRTRMTDEYILNVPQVRDYFRQIAVVYRRKILLFTYNIHNIADRTDTK